MTVYMPLWHSYSTGLASGLHIKGSRRAAHWSGLRKRAVQRAALFCNSPSTFPQPATPRFCAACRPALLSSVQPVQWRTQKIFMGGVWFRVIWWSFVFGVRCLWRQNLTSYSCFQTNVLAKFVDKICIFFYTHSPYFMCHCTECKLLALQFRLSEENKLNATTQQFITAKISGCALKQGSETHSSLR